MVDIKFTVIDGGKPAQKKIAKEKPRDLALDHLQKATEHLEAALETGIRGVLRSAIEDALEAAQGANAPKPKQLTDLSYEALKPGKELVNPQRPGFRARRTRKGVRFFMLTTNPDTGKQREVSIGYMGLDISLTDARAVWADLRQQRLQGAMPKLREEGSGLPTIKELVNLYLREYAEKVKRSWRDDMRLLNRHVL